MAMDLNDWASLPQLQPLLDQTDVGVDMDVPEDMAAGADTSGDVVMSAGVSLGANGEWALDSAASTSSGLDKGVCGTSCRFGCASDTV